MAEIVLKLRNARLPAAEGWQCQTPRTFGKFLANCFFGGRLAKGKSENRRVIIDDLMVGLGGLEPPTSPLSGAGCRRLRNDLKNPREGL